MTKESEAENFINLLEAEIENTGREDSKLAQYLHYVVPFWSEMEPNRLYKHIQSMLDNAEQIRRFEIDLVWKRAVYFTGLLIIFFGAFGYVFFADEKNIYLYECKFSLNEFLLPILALANAVLSLFFTILNTESHRWQRNWEYHVDYLQELMGVKLMRTHLRYYDSFSSIRMVNTITPSMITSAWVSITVALIISLPINYFITIPTSIAIVIVFLVLLIKLYKKREGNGYLSTASLEEFKFCNLDIGDRLNKEVAIKSKKL